MNWQSLKYQIATGFGCGKFPFAPGTFASLIALLLLYFIPFSGFIWLGFCIVFFLVGIWASGSLEEEYGEDPQIVVIDEIVGQWVSLLFLPKTFWIYLIGFLLFRFMDILKPFPVKEMEDFKGGYGIMLDDLIAGILVNVALNVGMILLNT